jgi:hypothetical protein
MSNKIQHYTNIYSGGIRFEFVFRISNNLIDGYHGFTSRDMPGKYFETGHSFPYSLLLVYKHFFTSSVTNKIIVAGHTGLLNNALTLILLMWRIG